MAAGDLTKQMDINYTNALVTGGAGFIGSHIVDALVTNGCNVTVIDNLSTGNSTNLEHIKDKITFHEADIRDLKILTDISKNCDVIFHQAAVVSVPLTVDKPVDSAMVNELGTVHVLEAARVNSIKRVILASSSAVYGDDPELPKKENMNTVPLTPYAVQKLTNEFYSRIYYNLYGLETVCLRYFNVFGPRQDPSSPYSGVISIFMTKAGNNEAPLIYGNGEQYRDFVFVRDVVRANLLASISGTAAGKSINIGTGRQVSVNELWNMIADMTGAGIKPEYKPARPGDIIASVSDISLAEKMLDFKPEYSFQKGLELTLKWYNT